MKPQEEVGGVGGAAATTTGKAANCQRICESVWVEVEEEKAVAKVLHRLRERDCVSGAVGRRRVGRRMVAVLKKMTMDNKISLLLVRNRRQIATMTIQSTMM